jgi:hypothetical protein
MKLVVNSFVQPLDLNHAYGVVHVDTVDHRLYGQDNVCSNPNDNE